MNQETKRDRIEMSGVVIDNCKNFFKVKISEDYTVDCSLSGKIRQNSIKILNGDRVTVEVSQYDTSKGRIVFRHK